MGVGRKEDSSEISTGNSTITLAFGMTTIHGPRTGQLSKQKLEASSRALWFYGEPRCRHHPRERQRRANKNRHAGGRALSTPAPIKLTTLVGSTLTPFSSISIAPPTSLII